VATRAISGSTFRNALVGVLFHRDDAQAVSVTRMWVDGDTLELSLELVPGLFVYVSGFRGTMVDALGPRSSHITR
jgi:hypothetical protein